MIFDEYRKFAYPKERPLDQQFIEMYDDSDIVSYAKKRHWLPLEWWWLRSDIHLEILKQDGASTIVEWYFHAGSISNK